jgi:hypothetical protein
VHHGAKGFQVSHLHDAADYEGSQMKRSHWSGSGKPHEQGTAASKGTSLGWCTMELRRSSLVNCGTTK